jgi:hypothetical protein
MEKTLKVELNHILKQSHQKPQKIQNLKIGLFLLILSIFLNRKTLNVEQLFMKIQYYLIFDNKKQQQK